MGSEKKFTILDTFLFAGKFVAEFATYLTILGYLMAGIFYISRADFLSQFLLLMDSWIKFYQIIIAGYVIGGGVKRGVQAYTNVNSNSSENSESSSFVSEDSSSSQNSYIQESNVSQSDNGYKSFLNR